MKKLFAIALLIIFSSTAFADENIPLSGAGEPLALTQQLVLREAFCVKALKVTAGIFASAGSSVYRGTKKYASDGLKTRGRSVVLAPAEPPKPIDTKLGVFVAKDPDRNRFLTKIFQAPSRQLTYLIFGKPYDFRPLFVLNEKAIKPATAYATKNLRGGPYQFSRTVVMLATMAAWGYGYYKYDVHTKAILVNHLDEKIQARGADLDRLLSNDVRMYESREATIALHMSEHDRRIFTARAREIQKDYINYIEGPFTEQYEKDRDGTNESILENKTYGVMLFHDIKELRDEGLTYDPKNFMYGSDFKPEIDNDTLDKLMKNRHYALYRYEVANKLDVANQSLETLAKDPAVQFFFGEKEIWSFISRNAEKVKSGKLTQDQFVALVQKYAFFDERMERYKILHIEERLNINGQVTERAVTMSDIENELN